MRHRYFSPQLRQTLQSYKQKQPIKLRWVGSQVKLSSNFAFEDQYQQKIGDYTYYTNKQIGSGYSSKVYRAYKLNDLTEYAIKVIDLKKYTSSNMQMLTNQVQILKSLNHPNIVKCYDVFRTVTQCCIVTQYCGSGDLLSYLGKKGRFAEKDALKIISDVIDGLKYLSEQSVIHRDLKPANILKSSTKWKIADFGFAIKSENQIRTRYNVGTPLYMPPQSLIQNLYSVKSDIFSVGIILYQLLVGCTPWQSRTQKDLIKKMAIIPFKIPQKYQISASLRNLLQKMCQVKVKKRMDKKQLLGININNISEVHQNPEQSIKATLRRQKSLDYFRQKLSLRNTHGQPKLVKLISSKSIIEAQQDLSQRKKQLFNNQLLICQLHYCRFLYYLIRNGNYVLVDKKKSQKLGVMVFIHLLKLVNIISDSNINYLNMPEWQKFKRSKKYLNTNLTIKQYCLRYEKEYTAYIKNIQLDVLQQINQMIPQMGKSNLLSKQFYGKIMRFLLPLLRTFNHNLGIKITKEQGELTKEELGNIQALRSILKYYRLLEMSITHFQDFEYFESHCNIKVNIDFKKSGATLEQFQQLRKQLKNF